MPINRFAVRFYNASGGIHISCDEKNKELIRIEFVNNLGGNIDRSTEKKIEQLFIREDFQRCNFNSIKPIINVDNFSSLYILNIINKIKNLNEIKRRRPKIFIASQNNNVISICCSLLEQLGCNIEFEHILSHKNTNSYIKHISSIVIKKNMDLGAIISSSGEDLTLIDNLGRVLDKDRYIILASLITLKSVKTNKIVVPYNTTMAIEDIAKQYNAQVIRTKLSSSNIMNEMLNSFEEGFMLQYILNFDAICALSIILDYIIKHSLSLSDIVDEIPEFYVNKKEIHCDFNDKGRIIRMLIEESKDKNIELFEGIKINTDKGWTLVLPDNEKPVLNIYTEGYSEEYANELSLFVADKINSLLKTKD